MGGGGGLVDVGGSVVMVDSGTIGRRLGGGEVVGMINSSSS